MVNNEHRDLLEKGDLDGLQRLLTRQGHGTAKVGRIFVPTLGTEVTLAAEWSFRLFYERRNEPLGTALGIVPPNTNRYDRGWLYSPEKDEFIQVTLPVGTILKVHRLYMRQGGEDFNSMTFTAKLPGAKKKPRFWAKLDDCHEMEFTL